MSTYLIILVILIIHHPNYSHHLSLLLLYVYRELISMQNDVMDLENEQNMYIGNVSTHL